MATQNQFLRQDVVAQQDLDVQQNLQVDGSTTLGDDPSDVVTVIGSMAIGGTTVSPVASAGYGPGPLTNEVIHTFPAAQFDAALYTVTVVDDGNTDVYAANLIVAHNGTTAAVSSPAATVDLWDGTNPTFSAALSGGNVQLRMSLADAVTVSVALDVKTFASQTSEFISITSQPSNDTVVEGDVTASFSITATTNDGGALSYQWWVDDGVTPASISDDATYSGALTNTLVITTTDTSLNSLDYYCVVTSTGGSAPVQSNSATLTVNTATVTISADPVNDSVGVGDPAAFSVTAATNETLSTLTYSWEEDAGSGFSPLTDTGVYSGTTTSALDISNATGLNARQYRCVVSTTSSVAPTATSAAATLTVPQITITAQPSNDSVIEGDATASFSVTATSNDSGTLSYQWRESSDGGSSWADLSDDATYSGALTSTLTITTTDTSLNTYQYECVVSSDATAPDATSDAATLTVGAAVVTIAVDPASVSVAGGNPHTFTVSASTNETLASLTYQWEVDSGSGFGIVTNGATGGGGNYSGATTASLAIDDVVGLDTYQYRCVVTSDSAIAPTATSAAATLTVT